MNKLSMYINELIIRCEAKDELIKISAEQGNYATALEFISELNELKKIIKELKTIQNSTP